MLPLAGLFAGACISLHRSHAPLMDNVDAPSLPVPAPLPPTPGSSPARKHPRSGLLTDSQVSCRWYCTRRYRWELTYPLHTRPGSALAALSPTPACSRALDRTARRGADPSSRLRHVRTAPRSAPVNIDIPNSPYGNDRTEPDPAKRRLALQTGMA